jgi:uncharacterized lipoprotein YajG
MLSACMRSILLMAVLFMFGGCTKIVKSGDMDNLKTGSPLKSVGQKVFSLRTFKDVRSVSDSSLLGNAGANYAMDQPVAIVAEAAVKKEFERNGHYFVTDLNQKRPDFFIDGSVYKFGIYMSRTPFTTTVTGNVAVKLTIESSSPDKRILIKTYEGKYEESRSFGFYTGTITDIINQALLGVVKDMSTDQGLIVFLEK